MLKLMKDGKTFEEIPEENKESLLRILLNRIAPELRWDYTLRHARENEDELSFDDNGGADVNGLKEHQA